MQGFVSGMKGTRKVSLDVGSCVSFMWVRIGFLRYLFFGLIQEVVVLTIGSGASWKRIATIIDDAVHESLLFVLCSWPLAYHGFWSRFGGVRR